MIRDMPTKYMAAFDRFQGAAIVYAIHALAQALRTGSVRDAVHYAAAAYVGSFKEKEF